MKMLNSVLLEGTLSSDIQQDMFLTNSYHILGDDGLRVGISLTERQLFEVDGKRGKKVRIVGKLIMKGSVPYISAEHIEYKGFL